MDDKDQVITASWINVIAGAWLMLSPFVLVYGIGIVRITDLWLGFIVGILALVRLVTPTRSIWLSWVNILTGVVLIIVPFVFGYTDNTLQMWNDVVAGIIIVADALWNSTAGERLASHQHELSA